MPKLICCSQEALAPYKHIEEDLKSLKEVLEMKNQQIHQQDIKISELEKIVSFKCLRWHSGDVPKETVGLGSCFNFVGSKACAHDITLGCIFVFHPLC